MLPADRSRVRLAFDPEGDGSQLLTTIEKRDGKKSTDLAILIKGECTTDSISASGPWLKYRCRARWQSISRNCLTGGTRQPEETNTAKNQATGGFGAALEAGAYYRDNGISGSSTRTTTDEGASRECAALWLRYPDGLTVTVCLLARIHETDLKEKRMLAFTFVDEAPMRQSTQATA